MNSSDAHTVAEKWGLNYRFWAWLWLCMSFVLTVVGIVFARDARETSWRKGRHGTIPHSQSDYISTETSVGPTRRDVEWGHNNRNMATAAVY